MTTKTKPKPAQDRQHATEGTFAANRKAHFDYDLLRTFDAGLVLTGSEIKSIRQGKASIREAYARVEAGEAWLLNMHIAPYLASGGFSAQDPIRRRKLLLHKDEIGLLGAAQGQKGFTLIPLRLYLARGRAKIELAIGRGRRSYDKREAIAKRDADREIARAVRHEDRA